MEKLRRPLKATEVLDLNGDRLWHITDNVDGYHLSPKIIKANNVLYRIGGESQGGIDNRVYSFNGLSWDHKFYLSYQSAYFSQFGVIRLPVEFIKQGC